MAYLERFKKSQFWKEGNASVLAFLASTLVIIAACMMVLDYCSIYMDAENAQLVADLAADGAVVAGDTLWGLDRGDAKKAVSTLTNANEALLEQNDIDLSTSSTVNTSKGQVSVRAWTKKESTYKIGSITATANASSKILYSGGRAVVMYAYKFSQQYYNYLVSNGIPDTRGVPGFKWTRYAWGAGRSWDSYNMPWYADCSGFVYSVFRKFGLNIGTWTGEMQNMGHAVSQSEARPGDIILFYSGGSSISSHVAIYAGEINGTPYCIDSGGGGSGTTVQNSPAGSGVKLRPVYWAASGRRAEYRRIIQSSGEAYDVPEPDEFTTAVYLLGEAGYNDVAIAGILGNWMWESGLCPITVQGNFGGYNDPSNIAYANRIRSGQMTREEFAHDTTGGGGYGLAQWTSLDRKRGLWDYCVRLNTNITNMYGQVMYAIHEMNTGYGAVSNKAFKESSDITRATMTFLLVYEGINDGTGPARIANAKMLYNRIVNM